MAGTGGLGIQDMLNRLSASDFRRRFRLTEKDKAYIRDKGWDTVRRHAYDLIGKRLAPAVIPNDGRQTPMRGHPVFIAQHATATCCRGCLYKWHRIPPGAALTQAQQDYVIALILAWLARQMQ